MGGMGVPLGVAVGHWGGTLQHDYLELEQALSTFCVPGQVFEVRLIHSGRKRIDAGYFDSPSHAATAICALNDPYQGVYFTPNPVVPDLAARAYNRIGAWAQLTTMDPDIVERHWILVDVDPVRPTGISATNEELDRAFKVARRIANMLELEGWPRPWMNASGNGVHLLYRVQEPNNEFVRDEFAKFLKILHERFKDDSAKVDTMNFNAARIWRLPGTWARKGDDLPERPHRKAHLLEVPLGGRLVTLRDVATFNSTWQHLLPNTQARTTTQSGKSEYPDDEKKYRGLNQQAGYRLSEWVPKYYPGAREYKQGYRVSSDELGQNYEEDLAIHPPPMGIKYFGVADQGDATEGRRTPISLLAETHFLGDKSIAARKLADTLNAPLTEFDTLAALGIDNTSSHANLPGIDTNKPVFDFSRVPSMAELQARTFADQQWLIKNVLPTGNIMLAARPKMRKTFLALQLGMAVASGGKFLNWQCEQGDVLFLGLEDNERRLKTRIKLLNTFNMHPPDLSGFRYWTGGVDISPSGKAYISNPEEAERALKAFPRGEAGVEALDQYLDTFPKTKLIVIDTLAHFRDNTSMNRDVYQKDYDQMMPITRLAARRKVLIMPVHHEKKGLASQASGDYMEDVSGTSGITGAVDGVLSIKGQRGVSDENESRKLLISGRDIPKDFDIDMAFDAERGGWLPAMRTNVEEALKDLLARHTYVNQSEFASLLPNISRARISQVLTKLKYDGVIIQSRFGYQLATLNTQH
jgi:biotin operon repressor